MYKMRSNKKASYHRDGKARADNYANNETSEEIKKEEEMSDPIRITVDGELLELVPQGDMTPLDPKKVRWLWFRIIKRKNEKEKTKKSKKT